MTSHSSKISTRNPSASHMSTSSCHTSKPTSVIAKKKAAKLARNKPTRRHNPIPVQAPVPTVSSQQLEEKSRKVREELDDIEERVQRLLVKFGIHQPPVPCPVGATKSFISVSTSCTEDFSTDKGVESAVMVEDPFELAGYCTEKVVDAHQFVSEEVYLSAISTTELDCLFGVPDANNHEYINQDFYNVYM